ncbi:MAG: hypothetical protein DWQ01_08520 [Planctomycetota bacterium]|nr:MAG: hypothetical protein DWQ01_08520 [Planctomycetota bacterium]
MKPKLWLALSTDFVDHEVWGDFMGRSVFIWLLCKAKEVSPKGQLLTTTGEIAMGVSGTLQGKNFLPSRQAIGRVIEGLNRIGSIEVEKVSQNRWKEAGRAPAEWRKGAMLITFPEWVTWQYNTEEAGRGFSESRTQPGRGNRWKEAGRRPEGTRKGTADANTEDENTCNGDEEEAGQHPDASRTQPGRAPILFLRQKNRRTDIKTPYSPPKQSQTAQLDLFGSLPKAPRLNGDERELVEKISKWICKQFGEPHTATQRKKIREVFQLWREKASGRLHSRDLWLSAFGAAKQWHDASRGSCCAAVAREAVKTLGTEDFHRRNREERIERERRRQERASSFTDEGSLDQQTKPTLSTNKEETQP